MPVEWRQRRLQGQDQGQGQGLSGCQDRVPLLSPSQLLPAPRRPPLASGPPSIPAGPSPLPPHPRPGPLGMAARGPLLAVNSGSAPRCMPASWLVCCTSWWRPMVASCPPHCAPFFRSKGPRPTLVRVKKELLQASLYRLPVHHHSPSTCPYSPPTCPAHSREWLWPLCGKAHAPYPIILPVPLHPCGARPWSPRLCPGHQSHLCAAESPVKVSATRARVHSWHVITHAAGDGCATGAHVCTWWSWARPCPQCQPPGCWSCGATHRPCGPAAATLVPGRALRQGAVFSGGVHVYD
jgi:hypothetical protein